MLRKLSYIVTGLLVYYGYFKKKDEDMPRGIRNNNAGNLRATSDNWKGKTGQDDKGFIIFSASFFGLRALAKILLNYNRLHGLKTIEQIINRYAPDSENNTNAYAEFISQMLKIEIDVEIDVENENELYKLMQWIVYYENGIQPYAKMQFLEAIRAT